MLKKNKLQCSIFLFFLYWGSTCFGQGLPTDSLKKLKITVVDSIALTPVDGCLLVVTDAQNRQLFSGISGKDGLIELSLNLKRAQMFYFTANFYKMKRRKLDFTNRDAATIGLASSTTILKEVTVMGSSVMRDADKLRYMVNSSKFTKGSDAITVLQDVPLVNVNGREEVQIKNKNATILVNGKPASSQMLRTIKAENIASVDVVTNPSSSYGAQQELNGIINIKLKESDIPQINGNLLLVAGTFRHTLFPGFSLYANSKKLYAALNSSYQSVKQSGFSENQVFDGAGILQSTQSNTAENSYQGANVSLSLYYNPNKSNQFSAVLGYSQSDIGSESDGTDTFTTPSNQFTNHNNYKQPSHTTSVNLEYYKKFGTSSSLTFSYGFQDRQSGIFSDFTTYSPLSPSVGASFDSDIAKQSHSGQVVWNRKYFKEKLSSEFGGLFSTTSSLNLNDSQAIGATTTTTDRISLEQDLYALFLTLRYNIGKYSLRAGARMEVLEQDYSNTMVSYDADYHNLFPNFVVKRSLGKQFDLVFNYQRRISRPDVSILNPNLFQYSNLESYRGSTRLSPELQDRYDLNLDYKAKQDFYEFSLYENYTKNPILYLVSRNGNKIEYNYVNIKNLVQYGASVSAKIALSKALSFNSNVFAERYSYDDALKMSARPSGYDFGGSLNLYWNIPKLFALSNNLTYHRLPTFGYQSHQIGYPSYNITISRAMLKNKLFVAANFKDVFDGMSRTRTFTDDRYFSQYRRSNSGTRDLVIQLSYSFGKTFYSSKSQNKIISNEEKTFKKL